MPILNVILRHAAVLLFALAVAALVNMMASTDRFIELSIIMAIICLILYHSRWVLGLKRPA
jgi:hypothetical protein